MSQFSLQSGDGKTVYQIADAFTIRMTVYNMLRNGSEPDKDFRVFLLNSRGEYEACVTKACLGTIDQCVFRLQARQERYEY